MREARPTDLSVSHPRSANRHEPTVPNRSEADRGARTGEDSETRTATWLAVCSVVRSPGDKRFRCGFIPVLRLRKHGEGFRRTPAGPASTSEAAQRTPSKSKRTAWCNNRRQAVASGGGRPQPGDEQRIIFQAGKPAGTTGRHAQDAGTGLLLFQERNQDRRLDVVGSGCSRGTRG